jgi:4'-phosphopantetheinyl transferase
MDNAFDESEAESHLSQEEITKSNQFRFAKDRRRYIYFHSVFRIILSEYCCMRPKDLKFSYNEFRKPSLEIKDFYFSFAHSNDLAICALASGYSVGVDIELLQEKIDVNSIANLFFSEEEKRILASTQNKNKFVDFYSMWTGKEAYGKAIGCGIIFPLNKITIPVSYSEFMRDSIKGLDENNWALERLFFREGKEHYIISSVSEGRLNSIDIFSYKQKLRTNYGFIKSY